MAGAEKTEKATPKKRADSRKKGQVAKSADVNGSVVLMASFLALLAFGGALYQEMAFVLRGSLGLIATPDVVNADSVGKLLGDAARSTGVAVAPIAFIAMAAGVLSSVAQVGFKPSAEILKPDLKKLNPISGAKNVFGPNMIFESLKTVVKVAVVGTIAIAAVLPQLPELAALVGLPAEALGARIVDTVFSIAMRAGFAYLLIAAADIVWQKYRTEKNMKMEKQEVIDEMKGQDVPAEVRQQIRRKQMQGARNRMMQDVPDADVVVVNPYHYAVALTYDGASLAPTVVAKGQDLIAAQIRRIAEAHDVPVVSDPPLARSLHASVEVGREIPEELFAAVAQLLAFVYRAAGRKVS